MSEGYSVRQLSDQSGYSHSKISRIINYWLEQAPANDTNRLKEAQHIIFDGTFLYRPVSIVALMDTNGHELLRGKYGVRENSERELRGFLLPLKEEGLMPKSCTTDGNPQAIRTIRSLWEGITMQRCVVHVQRQGLMWCRKYPKRTDAKHLRNLFLKVTYINTPSQKASFLVEVAAWEQRYGSRIATSSERGYVFSDLRRARSMLLKAIPNLFHYLDDSKIPRTTNGIEGYFSRLKRNYRNHRGLNPNKHSQYFDWYFHLKPR